MFKKTLTRFTDQAYLLLRVFAGLMFSFHGLQKVFGFLAVQQPPVGSQVWCGGVIEVIGGLLIAAGLFTRCAAFVSSGTMAVAYIQFHWRFAFDKSFFPAVNKGELAVVYAFVFLYIACQGAGPFSLDAKRGSSCV